MKLNDINQIRNSILKKYSLKIGDKIGYQLLHRIYLEYIELFEEKVFAKEILQISHNRYYAIRKNLDRRTTILKNEKIDIELLREEILRRYSLRPGDKINYEKLSEISSEYMQITQEIVIACEVLGVSKRTYHSARNGVIANFKILANIFKQNIDKLRNRILENEGLSPGDYINYEQLDRIANKYGVSNVDLATKIFGIKPYNYYNIKRDANRRTKIAWKNNEKEESKSEAKNESELNKLRNRIIENENLIPGGKIDYEQLHGMYLKYGSSMEELKFACSILGIKRTRYYKIKADRKLKAVILKELVDELIEKVRIKLIEEEGINPGDTINYEELIMLTKRWKGIIDETIFVRSVLEISAPTVYEMKKNLTKRAIVMRGAIEEVPEEAIIAIRNEIFENEKIKIGATINYKEFLSLYEKYNNGLRERAFALEVLSFSIDSYSRIRNDETKRAIICRDHVRKLKQNELDDIRRSIYEEFGNLEWKKINYRNLHKIAEKWSDIVSERNLATRVLGISRPSYDKIKHNPNLNTYVLDPRKKEISDQIRYRIRRESRFFTLEEIQELCRENELTIEDFSRYVVSREFHSMAFYGKNLYGDILSRKGKIYIGKKECCTREFARKNQDDIIRMSRRIARELCLAYQEGGYINDCAQDVMLFFIERCGDLEKNFEDDARLCKVLMYSRARLYAKGKILLNKKVQKNVLAGYDIYTCDKSSCMADKEKNTEQEAIDNLEKLDEYEINELIDAALELINRGVEPVKAISMVGSENNLSFRRLMAILINAYANEEKTNLTDSKNRRSSNYLNQART